MRNLGRLTDTNLDLDFLIPKRTTLTPNLPRQYKWSYTIIMSSVQENQTNGGYLRVPVSVLKKSITLVISARQKFHWKPEQLDDSLPRSHGSLSLQSPILQDQCCIKLEEKDECNIFEKQEQKLSLVKPGKSILATGSQIILSGKMKRLLQYSTCTLWCLEGDHRTLLRNIQSLWKREINHLP